MLDLDASGIEMDFRLIDPINGFKGFFDFCDAGRAGKFFAS
jgi:hypothetical protein